MSEAFHLCRRVCRDHQRAKESDGKEREDAMRSHAAAPWESGVGWLPSIGFVRERGVKAAARDDEVSAAASGYGRASHTRPSVAGCSPVSSPSASAASAAGMPASPE